MKCLGRFTPGTFTNQSQPSFVEPRVVLVTDPVKDHQPITEASYMNIPVIAFTNTNASLRGVDIAIPCNTEVPLPSPSLSLGVGLASEVMS